MNSKWGHRLIKQCFTCGKDFRTFPSMIKNGGGKYCSHVCQPVWNKGKKLSIEHIKKLSISHKGQVPWSTGLKMTEEFKRKVSKGKKGQGNPNLGKWATAHKGEKSPTWKGGKGTERRRLMVQKEYVLWRTAVFIRDDYTCQKCGVRGGILNADHIKPWSLYPELRYSIDNGRTLCVPCHRQSGTWGRGVFNFRREAN